jgi:predicted  nucleic acid-binding Zn-ribbon protein
MMIATLLFQLNGIAHAQDLNWEKAQAEYEDKKAISDEAARNVNREEAPLAPYLQRVQNAQQRVNNASSALNRAKDRLTEVDREISSLQQEISRLQDQVQRLEDEGIRQQDQLAQAERNEDRLLAELNQNERQIERIERRIRELENRPNNGDWTCVYVDNGHEEHRGGHRSTHQDREEARRLAEEECKAVHGNCRLAGCDQPASSELEQLREELRQLRNERQDLQNQLSNVRSDISSLKNSIARIREDIRSVQSQIRNKQNEVETLRRDRDRILLDISEARSALDQARNDLSLAESDLARARIPYDRAVAEYNRAKAETDAAYRYLQQVIANYNAAKKRVLDLANAQGLEHGAKEAAGRASGGGTNAGNAEGEADGGQKGEADGRMFSEAKGYRSGRENPAATPEGSASFAQGQSEGQAWAEEKARLENLPKGFNAAYAEQLSSIPVNIETIDISEEISTNPGGQGHDLTGAIMVAGNKPAPRFDLPVDPQPKAPSNRQPRISTPSPTRSEASAPCTNLPRPEFEPLCREKYEESYVQGFGNTYRTEFTLSYTRAYNTRSAEVYQQKYNAQYPDSFTKGVKVGARDVGILQGFADSLAMAEQNQYAAGRKLFEERLKNGYMLAVRSSEIEETNGDGVMMPGEKVKLSLVIDNLGNEASPLDQFTVKIQETAKASGLNFEVRQLPSLAPNTRTKLVGVVTLTSASKYAGERLSLKAALFKGAVEVSAFEASRETHFPLELIDLKLDRAPRVNEAVEATAVFKNMSHLAQKAEQLKIYTSPQVVKVDNGVFPVDELAPGAVTEKRINLTPGVWVSESVPVDFLSEVQSTTGEAAVTQAFSKQLDIRRTASIVLTDSQGRPLNMPLVVRAGGRVQFRAQAKYNETTTRPGPFVLKYTRTQPDTIRPSNNSTISTNYGSLGPNHRPSPMTFSFDVPSNLAGTQGYIMIQLDEGRSAIHAPQIYLDIR